MVTKRVVFHNHLLLPSYFTWPKLHDVMTLAVANSMIRRAEPSETTFRRLLMEHCPDISIRSPRDNVCDTCVIYKNQSKSASTTEAMEFLGKHTEEARRIRTEYKKDVEAANADHIVLTIDFAQNLSLPHVAETPSQWYFMSLVSVSDFGIHSTNVNQQLNYVYSERKGGKVSNEVISMLDMYVEPEERSDRVLTVYADNCGGQNKNNNVIKYFLLLSHIGYFKEVHSKFFVRGHTKNNCDRGFGMLKKRVARHDCWTLDQLKVVLQQSSIASDTEILDENVSPFGEFKEAVSEMYKNLPAIQKYQIFTMRHDKAGVVDCRTGPDSLPEEFDLRKTYDGIRVTPERVDTLYSGVDSFEDPPVNVEKLRDIFKNVRPYVPEEYQNDEMYAEPNQEQLEAAMEIKRARARKGAAKKTATEKTAVEKMSRFEDMRSSAVAMRAAELREERDAKRKKVSK